jgi:hypothetical protein
MHKLALLSFAAAFALSLPASAAIASPAECQAHLAAGVTSMTADRFAEELAGAEGMAGNATPAIHSAAILLTDLNTSIRDRTAELAALKDQLARVQTIAIQLAELRKNPTSGHYLDPTAETTLDTLESNLTARVTAVNTALESERTALSQNLLFHCTANGPASSASAH